MPKLLAVGAEPNLKRSFVLMIVFFFSSIFLVREANAADEKYKFCAIRGMAIEEENELISSLALTMIFRDLPSSTCSAVSKEAQELMKRIQNKTANRDQVPLTKDEWIWLDWFTDFKSRVYASILKGAGYSVPR